MKKWILTIEQGGEELDIEVDAETTEQAAELAVEQLLPFLGEKQ